MAAKSANLYARIEPEVKEKAESILSALGIPASSAINMFYKQIILQRGLPFEVKIPSSRPIDMSSLSETELNEELEKGYSDIKAGRTREASAVFEDIRKDYNLWFMKSKLLTNQVVILMSNLTNTRNTKSRENRNLGGWWNDYIINQIKKAKNISALSLLICHLKTV